MTNIIELIKRRRLDPPQFAGRTMSDGVVDLTSDDEADVGMRNTRTTDHVDLRTPSPVRPVTPLFVPEDGESEDGAGDMSEDGFAECFENCSDEPESTNKFQEIPCPVCALDISKLSLNERESHVELCLLQPSKSTYIYQKSPKKPKTNPVPKEKPEPKPRKAKVRTKPLPYFKIITLGDHRVIVDGFSYADGPSKKYFLSHFHSDHYGGLFKNWDQGVIYCSKITADLAMNMFKISTEKFVVIPMEEKTEVEDGLWVTQYDANHCPGAVVFLFETDTKKVLHTGDFRVSKQIIDTFKDTYVDEIYLDTTYLNPQYSFYDQRLVVSSTVEFISNIVLVEKKPRGILDYITGATGGFVILVGSYSIGKEKIFVSIARALNTKIFVSKTRYTTLQLSGMDMSMFSHTNEEGCMLYVVHFGKLTDKSWMKRFARKHIIVVRPTGWSFSRLKKVNKEEEDDLQSREYHSSMINKCLNMKLAKEDFHEQLKSQWERGHTLSVPYSEHSSFKELTLFATLLHWGKMIPTVSVDNMEYPHWFDTWKKMEIPYTVVENHYTPHHEEYYEKNE